MSRQMLDVSLERDDEVTAKALSGALSPFDDINAEIEKFEGERVRRSSGNAEANVNVANRSENSTNILNQVRGGSGGSRPIVPVVVPTYRYPQYYRYPYYGYGWPYTYPIVNPYAVPQPAVAPPAQVPPQASVVDSLSALVAPPTAAPVTPSFSVSNQVLGVGASLLLVSAIVAYVVYKKKVQG